MTVESPSSKAASGLDDNVLLRKALQRAGEELGLSAQETAQAIGKSRAFFEQGRAQNRIDPQTRQMIALVLRLHRSLSALVGDDVEARHPDLAAANHRHQALSRWERGCPLRLASWLSFCSNFSGSLWLVEGLRQAVPQAAQSPSISRCTLTSHRSETCVPLRAPVIPVAAPPRDSLRTARQTAPV